MSLPKSCFEFEAAGSSGGWWTLRMPPCSSTRCCSASTYLCMLPLKLQPVRAYIFGRYLSDGSLQLDMPRSVDKSHYDTGGLLLRRQKIVNNQTGRPFQVQDFALGGCYELFAFRFRIGTQPSFAALFSQPHFSYAQLQATSTLSPAQRSSSAAGRSWAGH
jgi:hypothetical protein